MVHSRSLGKSIHLAFLLSIGSVVCLTTIVNGQANLLPYHQLPGAPVNYSAGAIASRMVDGLGFRFYWATEGLKSGDLEFRPSKESRTSRETIEHIYSMSFMILNATTGSINADPKYDLSFEDLRKKTLENFKAASENLRTCSDEALKGYAAKFKAGDQIIERPFWDIVSGPIEDCVWHTGQVVTFRRSSGNPISDKVNFFTGTVN